MPDYSRRLAGFVDRKVAECRLKQQPSTSATPAGSATDSRVVLSFEGFCGPMHTNRDDRLLAETLYALTGPVKVVFVIRQQYKLLYSIWAQYVKEGGRLGLRDFLTSDRSPAQPQNSEQNIFLRVQYDRYIEHLIGLFGRDQVRVLLFEDFVADYAKFMRQLYEFLEVDADKIPPNATVWRGPNYFHANVFRMLNRISTNKHHAGLLPYGFFLRYRRWFQRRVFPSRRWNPSTRMDSRRFVPHVVQQQIQISNRRLGEMLGRDLGDVGYAV